MKHRYTFYFYWIHSVFQDSLGAKKIESPMLRDIFSLYRCIVSGKGLNCTNYESGHFILLLIQQCLMQWKRQSDICREDLDYADILLVGRG